MYIARKVNSDATNLTPITPLATPYILLNIAGIVNPLGTVEQSVKFGKSGYVDFKENRKIQPTIFSKYGNKIFGLLILLYIFLIFSFNKIKNE